MKKKNICIVTGTRAEYNYLKPIIQKIHESNLLEPKLIVTGMHLLKKFGYTIDIIRKDGIKIDKIILMYDENDNSKAALGKAVGKAIIDFSNTFQEMNPDLLLVLGDRYEPLVAVIAASTFKIPIAHVHGGDISSTIDENIRHTITKLSHIHFPATEKSAQRIALLGEEKERIHLVGSTTIDNILKIKLLSKNELCRELLLNKDEKIVLCLQHPNIYESEKAGEQMRITLKVLRELNLQAVIIYPNNDLGSELIIKEIERNRDNPKFRIFKNLERKYFLSLLKHADLMVGNSSSGLIETPYFHLPVVNIGSRNENREKAENVINVDFEEKELKKAILTALSPEFREKCKSIKNPYGDGTSSDKIVKVLENLEINEKLLNKKLAYEI
ncbi:MAG: UDP-N-acetylglucosamine 2-epimerase [Promethearchaeota archaeon]